MLRIKFPNFWYNDKFKKHNMFYPLQVFDGSDRVIKKLYHDSILPYCNHASDMLVTIVRAGVSTNPCWPCLGQSDERAPRVAVVRSGF